MSPGSAFVLGGARTPFTRFGTDLSGVHAADLAAAAARGALERSGVDPGEVDEVILGNVAGPADATNIARVAALRAGLSDRVPAVTVNRNCGSALEAIAQAALEVGSGRARVVLAGGTESMSRVPLLMPDAFTERAAALARARGLGARLRVLASFRPRHLRPYAGLRAGLTDGACGLNMGETAEVLVGDWNLSREDQDHFALESHLRTAVAHETAVLDEEIVPVEVPDGRRVEHDNGFRPNQSIGALARLRPVFSENGTVTAGNSSQITDGAALVVVASEERAAAGRPLGRIASWAFAALDPRRMGLGPAHSSPVALDRAGSSLEAMDRIELNEAFAAVVLANREAMASGDWVRENLGRDEPLGDLDPARTNVNGGAIALGHPVGATGARLVLTLLLELARSGGRRGLATLCIGGGQGGAMVVEAA